MKARTHAAWCALVAALLLLALPRGLRAQDAASAAPAASAAAEPAPAPNKKPAERPKPAEPKPEKEEGEPVDLRAPTTPRRAMRAFLHACERGDFEAASRSLDLRGLPRGRETREGPELAAMLYRVLAWRIPLAPDSLPDEPSPPGVGPEGVVLDVVEVEEQSFTLALVPIRQSNGETRWMFSRGTVGAVRTIYDANERLVVEDKVPEWLKRRPVLGLMPWQWLGLLLLAFGSFVVGHVLGSLLSAALVHLAKQFSRTLLDAARSLQRPVRLALAIVIFEFFTPFLVLNVAASSAIQKGATVFYIMASAWAVVAMMQVLTASWERRLPEDTLGDLESRGLRTRLTMLRRIGTVVVVLVAAGVALLQFEVVRNVGVSLLASAGIAGVLVGIAAQRTLGGIIAGIEMSITQPVRIGDVVVFRGIEHGTVEQIYFTYIIVRLWDDRRLIVPVTRVMAEPFENWTRTDARLFAPVEIFVDYATPLDKMREAFKDLCESNDKWDGRTCRVEVIETTDKAIKIRGVASVDVATKAVDLRHELREGWVRYVQELEGGRYLPIGRVESRENPNAKPAAPTEAAPLSVRTRGGG